MNKTTGALLMLDININEVTSRDKTHIFSTQGGLISEWLQEQVDEINGDVDLICDIHFDCPNINIHPDYRIKPYSTIKPLDILKENYPTQPQRNKTPKLGFFASLFKSKKFSFGCHMA